MNNKFSIGDWIRVCEDGALGFYKDEEWVDGYSKRSFEIIGVEEEISVEGKPFCVYTIIRQDKDGNRKCYWFLDIEVAEGVADNERVPLVGMPVWIIDGRTQSIKEGTIAAGFPYEGMDGEQTSVVIIKIKEDNGMRKAFPIEQCAHTWFFDKDEAKRKYFLKFKKEFEI